jgi:hypothetical protein
MTGGKPEFAHRERANKPCRRYKVQQAVYPPHPARDMVNLHAFKTIALSDGGPSYETTMGVNGHPVVTVRCREGR